MKKTVSSEEPGGWIERVVDFDIELVIRIGCKSSSGEIIQVCNRISSRIREWIITYDFLSNRALLRRRYDIARILHSSWCISNERIGFIDFH